MGYSVNPTFWEARAEVWHDQSTTVNGNAISGQINTSQRYAMIAGQFPSAVFDIWTNSVVLEAGTYDVFILGVTGPGSGMLDLQVDSVQVSVFDFYTGAPVNNAMLTGTVSVLTTGRHLISGVVSDKNVASLGYEVSITKIWFKPTTDTESHS